MINKTILRNELFMSRWTLLFGGLIIAGLLGLFASFADLIMNSMGEGIAGLLSSMPPALLEAFNFNLASLHSFEGWMASEPRTFYTLILGIMVAIWASTTVNKELDQGTAESIVSLPVSRSGLFLSKVASHLIVGTVIATAGVASALLVGNVTVGVKNPVGVVLMLVSGYLTALSFAGIGYAITSFVDSERTALSMGSGVVLLSFIMNIAAGLGEKLRWIGKFSLFNLFDAHAIAIDRRLPLLPVCVALLLYVAGVVVGVIVFRRKSLNA